jgi:hypothetical protein
MRRYYITAIKNKGRDAWMVNYPAKDNAGGRLRWKRKQNMFWNSEKAEAFLEEQKREQATNGWTVLAGDRLLHCDVLRGAENTGDGAEREFRGSVLAAEALSWHKGVARRQVRSTDEPAD